MNRDQLAPKPPAGDRRVTLLPIDGNRLLEWLCYRFGIAANPGLRLSPGLSTMAFRPKTADPPARSISAKWLRELHQGNLDSARVFREAAHVVSDESVAAICDDISRRRGRYAEELEEYLTAFESEDHASLTTVVHRAWLDLRASFSTANPKAVLAEVLRGERRLDHGYERASAALSDSPVLGMIRRQTKETAVDTRRLAELHAEFAVNADESDDEEEES